MTELILILGINKTESERIDHIKNQSLQIQSRQNTILAIPYVITLLRKLKQNLNK